MDNGLLLLLIILLPFAGSFILPLLGLASTSARNILCLIFVGCSLIFSMSILPVVMSGTNISIAMPNILGSGIFLADKLAVFMAMVSSMVGAIIVFYSFGYISHYEHQNEYYWMVCLFLGSMMGLVFSNNLLVLYVFWEVTAIASWRLIGFFRDKKIVLKADKAFLVTVFGSLMMLLGFIMVYQQAGSFDLTVIKERLQHTPISDTAVAFILMGILAKSATLPLHTWLPDAGVAPSPVTALLHAAVLVKIGVYVYARLFVATFQISDVWHVIVPVIAGTSAIVSAGAAFVETDMKRIIAYSTISQIGFIFLGLSIGNGMGLAGGLLYILMHGMAKGGLFLCAGIIEHQTHTKDITKMGGLIEKMPVTAAAFLLCAFSVMGIPPFGGFFSKYMVIAGAAGSGQMAITYVFVIGAFMTMIYLFRLFRMIFLGKVNTEPDGKEGTPGMVFSVALLAVLSLAAGIFIALPSDIVSSAVTQMTGMVIR
ncbi:MAG: NADH-quinone oxidoreductase subunit L [Firmicutes bacterium]|nr:NADH-quinone oxidoreductase subunit L [Bacillota bacterium]